MMGKQVGRYVQHRGQLRRCRVADGECVDDAQPRRFGEGRVQRGSALQPGLSIRRSLSDHCLNVD